MYIYIYISIEITQTSKHKSPKAPNVFPLQSPFLGPCRTNDRGKAGALCAQPAACSPREHAVADADNIVRMPTSNKASTACGHVPSSPTAPPTAYIKEKCGKTISVVLPCWVVFMGNIVE